MKIMKELVIEVKTWQRQFSVVCHACAFIHGGEKIKEITFDLEFSDYLTKHYMHSL